MLGEIRHDTAAAWKLVERAYTAETQAQVTLLLGSAKRLDPTIDTEAIEAQWREKWLKEQKDKRSK